MKRIACAFFVSALLAAPVVSAQKEHQHGAQATPAAKLTAGVVRKIDREAGKISIAHEPIENLGMPKMTMVFRVKETAMLDAAKEGDKVQFAADKIQGAYTLTRIEAVK